MSDFFMSYNKVNMKDAIIKKDYDGDIIYVCPYCRRESRYGQRMHDHMFSCEKEYFAKLFNSKLEKQLNSYTIGSYDNY